MTKRTCAKAYNTATFTTVGGIQDFPRNLDFEGYLFGILKPKAILGKINSHLFLRNIGTFIHFPSI
jgi:hypothetical protein